MELDFRVDAGIFQSVKIQRLFRRLGDSGFVSLVRLWAYARQHRPDGVLARLDDEGVAIAAGWPSDREPSDLVSVLSELILIEKSDDGATWRIHDWASANPYSTASKGRREHAQRVNHERWHVKAGHLNPSCSLCVASGEAASGAAKVDQSSEVIATDFTSDNRSESSGPLQTNTKPKSSSAKKKRATKGTKVFTPESDAFRLSQLLFEEIRKNDPKFPEPRLQTWAADADRLMRVDRREFEEIKHVIHWTQADDFWRSRILSIKKLRKNFPTLKMQCNTCQATRPGDGRAGHDFDEFKSIRRAV